MQGGEGTEDDWGRGEGFLVALTAEQFVDAHQPACRSVHVIRSRRKTIYEFVPRCCAGKHDLNQHANEVHIAERSCPIVEGFLRSEKPEENGNNDGEREVKHAVRQPCEDVQDWMRESGEDI